MNILIVEDDKNIRDGICEFLSEYGYNTLHAPDGAKALRIFNEEDVDLILLDIQLPVLNGLEVLRRVREVSLVPILMLTAFNDEEYKINAFSNLADGYIEKPFSLPVLKARIDSLYKKNYGVSDVFKCGDAEVNFDSYSAKIRGNNIDINAKEFEILKYLLRNEGKALTRGQIIDNVWNETEEIPFDRVIDVYIKELRRKLGLDCIKTIRNVGYKLERR